MKKPFKPFDEKVRLKTLRSLNILDTDFEERFDRITRIAKKAFDVPIALFSLVDEERQWFKSCIGLDVREMPRDISFCSHAILGKDVFVVPDASKDERFADNPLVTAGLAGDSPIRFYAGYPIKFSDGSQLGTLCIIDHQPREFSNDEHQVLIDIGKMIEEELISSQVETIDSVTDILNHRGFTTLGQHSLNLSIRKQVPSILTYIDLNQFKQVNLTYGREAGDKALAEFARLICEACPQAELIARIASDEFAILFEGETKASVELIMSKLEEKIFEQQQSARTNYNMSFLYVTVRFKQNQHSTMTTLLDDAHSQLIEKMKNKQTRLEQLSVSLG